MDLEEMVKMLADHNEANPDHKTNCPCLDLNAVELHGFIARQDRRIREQMFVILRLSLRWDDMRGPLTGPLPAIRE